MADHPELPLEQAYVDHAYDCVADIRRQLERVAEAVDAPEYQAAHFETWARKRLETFEDIERGLIFGRLDLDGLEPKLYVGRRWVHEGDTPLVVNWQAPAARPFYTATVADPHGVVLRRRFRVDGRRLLDLFDEPLDGSAGDVVHGVADILLEELDRNRDEHMRDIVATIQADQYRLITREPDGILVIQGGPGTGKTAVGLHRASWLLYTHRSELERNGVLVVGPNPIFMDYISHVLPMLGEDRVEQRSIDELAGFKATRVDSPEVARAKGDTRMASVLAGVIPRLPVVPTELAGIRVDGAYLYLEPEQLAELIASAQESARSYADARERFRTMLVRRLYEQYARKLDDLAFKNFEELEKSIRVFTTGVLDQSFPRVKPEQLVRRALAEEGLPAGRGWSESDLALLDEARALLDGPPIPHGHLIVDEAQDLTPMQLRMLARRSTGPMTILGDIAQASGAFSYHRWDEVLEHLAADAPTLIDELRLAYRVPREVMELALPLLPLIAPDVAPPIAYRAGDAPPRFVETTARDLVATAAREATDEALREGRTALIAPAALLKKIDPALGEVLDTGATAFGDDITGTVRTLTPRAAKGLEFDRVVLVEPASVVAELGDVDGLRALYVALTRATKTLVIVHAKPLPAPLAAP